MVLYVVRNKATTPNNTTKLNLFSKILDHPYKLTSLKFSLKIALLSSFNPSK